MHTDHKSQAPPWLLKHISFGLPCFKAILLLCLRLCNHLKSLIPEPSAESMASAPTPPVHLIPFARSVMDLLAIWPALKLSFEQSNSYQSPSAQQAARSEIATELVGAFLDAQPAETPSLAEGSPVSTPSQEDIEDFLLSWIFATLDVRIEDESEILVSGDLIELWKEWSRMATSDDEELVRRQGTVIQRVERLAEIQRTRGRGVEVQVVDEGRIGDEGESENEMELDANPSHQGRAPNGLVAPVVDEDGFTLVTKSSTRH
ncbi:hypothetical protein O181_049041 [Austropuccinia psidii MF-1]|uniref:Uncharacterized protein n=1 Tax=Austropuccinia psidii MF-1 TaxID=1389203 RepID=A0A9Q3DRQ1_9BASI|nr:hypothetical protein [Austropuccinia psidii MF-1]